MTFPRFLPYRGRTYSVLGVIGEVESYRDNKGYIDNNGRIWIASVEHAPAHNDVPIIFIKKNGEIEYKDVNAPNIIEVFRAEYLHDLSYKCIVDETAPDEQLYNEEALSDINAATSVFIPTINEHDDPLKKIVKQAIISKKIDINRLKHKMPQKYGLTNMKSALIGKTKMSITNFQIWCELLELTFHFVMEDNGKDRQTPLKDPILYSSDIDRITINGKTPQACTSFEPIPEEE